MFCRVVGGAALGLLISSAAWAQDTQGQGTTGTTDKTGAQTQDTSTTQTTTTTTQTTDTDSSGRPRLELTGFAGYTFNEVVDFNTNRGITDADVNFYNSIGQSDRFSYGAGIGYEVTPNLQVGFLWSRFNSPLEMRGFSSSAALAGGWSGPGGSGGGTAGGGTGGTGTAGTGSGSTGGTSTGTGTTTRSFPVLTTTNGADEYRIGDMAVNTFHGTLGWNFGPADAVVRPFIFGGAGVTRYGEVNYQFANTTGTGTSATSTLTSARIASDSRFSTTWGVGVKIAPRKGLGVRIAGRWTPTRLSGGNLITTGTGSTGTGSTGSSTSVSGSNNGWWCDAYWGCFAGNKSQFLNQFSLTGGLTVRF